MTLLDSYQRDYKAALERENHLREMVNETRRKLSEASRNRSAIGRRIAEMEAVMANKRG